MKLKFGRSVRTALSPIVTLVVLIGIFGSSPAQGALSGYDPCLDPEKDQTFGWMGDMHGIQVTVPNVAQGGPSGFNSVVFGPKSPSGIDPSSPKLPAVVFQGGGQNGDICDLAWAAKYLAGIGYITEIHQTPASPETDGSLLNGLRGSASAVSFLRSSSNPYKTITDPNQIGIAGYRLGASVASYLQGNPSPADTLSVAAGLNVSNLNIGAIVAFDNLSRWVSGDWGAGEDCAGQPRFEVTPRVPAIGLAPDEPCPGDPARMDPYLKQPGWSQWRSEGIPSMELVLRDFETTDFSRTSSEARRATVAYWLESWFYKWLSPYPRSGRALTARRPDGVDLSDQLSSKFKSASCISYVATDSYKDYLSVPPPPIPQGFVGECEVPQSPSAVELEWGPVGASTRPLVVVRVEEAVRVRLYANDSCQGKPVRVGTIGNFSRGMPVRVAKASTTTFRATAVNESHGQESSCSGQSATYRQIDPVFARPSLRTPKRIRPGTEGQLRIAIHNKGIVASEPVWVSVRSSNRRVRILRQVRSEAIQPGETEVLRTTFTVGKRARGKTRIKVKLAGKESSRVVRILR